MERMRITTAFAFDIHSEKMADTSLCLAPAPKSGVH
jgi:hypothetical protein